MCSSHGLFFPHSFYSSTQQSLTYRAELREQQMAEAFLFEAASGILRQLGSALLREIGLLWGLKDDFERLKGTVSTIQLVLVDAEEKQETDPLVKNWLERLKDAFDDADNLLDEFSSQVLRRQVMTEEKRAKQVRIFFSRSNQIAFGLKMGHKIKAINGKLDAIAQDRHKFHLHEGNVVPQFQIKEHRETYGKVNVEDIIGRVDDKRNIIELLSGSNVHVKEDVSIIPIVGIGGVGKTTLAQLVYNDENIADQFEFKMWVCVSHDFDVVVIGKKIIESATHKYSNHTQLDEVQHHLHKIIEGKKYLLVLDDVWNECPEKWSKLRDMLMVGARGSKILVTTRSHIVARITGTLPRPYLLGNLSKDDAWSLFKKMAFKDGEDQANSWKEEVGREIMEKCAQVPLAIKSVGSLLQIKDTEQEWLHFKDNDLAKIAKEEDIIMSTLKLSYNHLPPQLKPCFAYCSLYPKDFEYDRNKLIMLWIAQGFVKPLDEKQKLEDVGESYFMELLRRSFFQEAQKDEWGNITECKMHDIIHDLAQYVARPECTSTDWENANDVTESSRHIYLNLNNCIVESEDTPSCFSRTKKLRTVILGQGNKVKEAALNKTLSINKWLRVFEVHCNEKVGLDFSRKGKYLRYLDLSRSSITILSSSVIQLLNLQTLIMHGCELTELPRDICKLVSLRYLDVSYNSALTDLPRSIVRLRNLQTLDLCGCSLGGLPKDFSKLVSLRHLKIDGNHEMTHMPLGLGQLTCLQKLDLFVVRKSEVDDSAGVKELQYLNNIRGGLQIAGLRNISQAEIEEIAREEAKYLKDKKYLHSLELGWNWGLGGGCGSSDSDAELLLGGLQPHPNLKKLEIKRYNGVNFPRWMMRNNIALALSNLTEIILYCCGECKDLPLLGQLPSLQRLELEGLCSVEYIENSGMVDDNDDGGSMPTRFYPSLKEMELSDMPKLRGWWRNGIRSTASKKDVAEQRQHLSLSFPCLVQLKIWDCPLLTSLPEQHSRERLELRCVDEELLQHQLIMTPSSSSSFPSPPLISTLKSLTIWEIQELVSLPEEGMRNLVSLQSLVIINCGSLTSLSSEFRRLTALETLAIRDCAELDLSNNNDNGIQFEGLKNLKTLKLGNMPKLVSLPIGLKHVGGSSSSLRRLELKDLHNLTTLPGWMSKLTALQSLHIWGCPQLANRCRKGEGEDWPKIAHIPDIAFPDEKGIGRGGGGAEGGVGAIFALLRDLAFTIDV